MTIEQDNGAAAEPPIDCRVSDCDHPRQIHKQTFVEIDGKWVRSTFEWMCLDCKCVGIETPKEAFQGDWIPRKQEITRDDR